MSDVDVPLSFPLDSDGFLRRACPSCMRDFKWLPSESSDDSDAEPPQYFCPYCGISAPADQWFTEEQVKYIQDEVMEQVIGPSLDDLSESMRDVERSSGGLIKMGLERPERTAAAPIFEPDDMRRVEFECHPSEPVKIVDSWNRDVHCLICGQATDAAAS